MYAERICAAGLPVAFVAEKERAARLTSKGVVVNGSHIDVPVIGWDHAAPARIIVAVKHHHLPEVCDRIGSLTGPETVIISVMNGIESEQDLQAAIDAAPDAAGAIVLPAMAAGMDAVRSGVGVNYGNPGRIFFGAPPDRPGPRTDEAVGRMRTFFDQAGIICVIPEDINHALWNKFMLNVGINQWSAVLRAPYRVFHQEGAGRNLMRQAMHEVLAVAEQRGIALREEDLEGWFPVVETLSASGKTSMLQDVEAGRKTEVEMFAGRVVAMGRELSVATPVNQALLDAIHVIEQLGVA